MMRTKFINLLAVTLLLLTFNNILWAKKETTSCQLKKNETELLTLISDKYLKFSSLYTGGMHFKSLGSVEGSSIIYLALNNQFKTIENITEKIKTNRNNTRSLRNTSVYLGRLDKPYWRDGKPYEISPSEVLESALKVILEAEPAYKHINNLVLPFAFHYRQAGFDLDILTSVAEPMDWWLKSEKPSSVSELKISVWKASKKNDFIDWLQFVTTTSSLPHLQNWNFKNKAEDQESISNLKVYARKKWLQTQSYAWLAALSEVSEQNDDDSKLVLEVFDNLYQKVSICNATQVERVAYGLIFMNAIRLGYGSKYDLKTWFSFTKEEYFKNIKVRTLNRLNQYVLVKESIKDYRLFWEKMGDNITLGLPNINVFTAKKADDFIVSLDEKKIYFHDTQLRFLSKLSVDELIKISEQPNISNISKTNIIRTSFLRSWINNDLSNNSILEKLAKVEPSLKALISKIVNESNQDKRKAKLLKLVMENPGLTYLLGVELYREGGFRPIDEFSVYNSEDGSWWCTTHINTIIDKIINSTIKPFGLIGSDPARSGGSWGAIFYNPGQKRAYLRNREIITDLGLNNELAFKLKKHHELLNYSKDDEWIRFSKLPPAPIYFSKKVDMLEKSSSVDDATMVELYNLLIRSAKRTCRKQNGVYNTLRDARKKLYKYHGIDLRIKQQTNLQPDISKQKQQGKQ